jgi:hypothetical protein
MRVLALRCPNVTGLQRRTPEGAKRPTRPPSCNAGLGSVMPGGQSLLLQVRTPFRGHGAKPLSGSPSKPPSPSSITTCTHASWDSGRRERSTLSWLRRHFESTELMKSASSASSPCVAPVPWCFGPSNAAGVRDGPKIPAHSDTRTSLSYPPSGRCRTSHKTRDHRQAAQRYCRSAAGARGSAATDAPDRCNGRAIQTSPSSGVQSRRPSPGGSAGAASMSPLALSKRGPLGACREGIAVTMSIRHAGTSSPVVATGFAELHATGGHPASLRGDRGLALGSQAAPQREHQGAHSNELCEHRNALLPLIPPACKSHNVIPSG